MDRRGPGKRASMPSDGDHEPDGGADDRDYRDRVGTVREGTERRTPRPTLLIGVVAVCGAGLLAGLGLFGGTAKKAPAVRPAA